MGERLSAKHHLNFMTLASFGSTMVPMNHSRTTLVMLALFATSLLRDGDLLGAEPVAKVDYITQIKPLLNTKCYSCHGALKQESELRLETRSLMLTGGEGGAVIVSGRSKDSPLFQRITADKDERMPPESEGSPLTADEISLLRNWIDQGAIAPVESIPAAPRDHWSFQSVVRPAVPKISDPRWSENPVDAFLAQRHQQLGLVPQQEAPRIILLRRLYLDLIGVPPTNEEIIAFENDKSDDWYEKTVQHLLDDPRHGQRWRGDAGSTRATSRRRTAEGRRHGPLCGKAGGPKPRGGGTHGPGNRHRSLTREVTIGLRTGSKLRPES